MSGTRAGGLKAAATNKERYGEDFYVKLGYEGGIVEVPKGFAKNREAAAEAGRKGGKVSRRRPAELHLAATPDEQHVAKLMTQATHVGVFRRFLISIGWR